MKEAPAPEKRPPRHVLLVEDHLDSREFMQALLESDGHGVLTAGTIAEAMNLLESERFDVIVSDIGLPDGSGWDLIATVRQRWPHLRVGVVTGWEPQSTNGADGDFILRKPVRTSEFLAQVSRT